MMLKVLLSLVLGCFIGTSIPSSISAEPMDLDDSSDDAEDLIMDDTNADDADADDGDED